MSELPSDTAQRDLWRRQRADIRDVLMRHWDPVGTSGNEEALDESDVYVGDLAALLRRGATQAKIQFFLADIERDRMGLQPNLYAGLETAKRLLALQNRSCIGS